MRLVGPEWVDDEVALEFTLWLVLAYFLGGAKLDSDYSWSVVAHLLIF